MLLPGPATSSSSSSLASLIEFVIFLHTSLYPKAEMVPSRQLGEIPQYFSQKS